jgi:hypothetical protein
VTLPILRIVGIAHDVRCGTVNDDDESHLNIRLFRIPIAELRPFGDQSFKGLLSDAKS